LGCGSGLAATTTSPGRRIAMGLEAYRLTIRQHTNAPFGTEVERIRPVAAQHSTGMCALPPTKVDIRFEPPMIASDPKQKLRPDFSEKTSYLGNLPSIS
jgi:hypothetical protein